MQLLYNMDWIRFGSDTLIIASAIVAAKLSQFILLKLLLRFSTWFHWQLNEKLETYGRKPLLYLLIFCFTAIAISFTSLHDIWIMRIQIMLQVLIAISSGWLLVSITRSIADWMRGYYSVGKDRDPFGARRVNTQIHLLVRVVIAIIVIFTVIGIAVAIPGMRKLGMSLFASAGVASLVIGMAANSTLSNLIAGVQIAITQPILLGDEIMVNNMAGTIEEIRASYVVVKQADLQCVIVPLNYLMQNPFVNRTYTVSTLDGILTFNADYALDINVLRADLQKIVEASDRWDHKTCDLRVSDFKDSTMELKVTVSARNSIDLAELQSEIREKFVLPLHMQHAVKS